MKKRYYLKLVITKIVVNFLYFCLVLTWTNPSWAAQPNNQQIDNLIEKLEYPNEYTEYAIDALVSIGKPALPTLILTLQKQNTVRRISIAKILGKMAELEDVTSAIPVLIQVFSEDKNPGVRLAIAETLFMMREDAAPSTTALIQGLQDEDINVRRKVIYALGAIGKKAAPSIPALIQALEDKDIWVRRSALVALAGIDERTELVVPTLIQNLDDKDAGIRSRSAFALGILKNNAVAAVPDLIIAIEDEDKEVRMKAVEALGDIRENPKSCVPVLIKALQDKEVEVRIQAVKSLKAFGAASESAVPALLEVLKDENPSVRQEVLFALGDIKLGVQPNSQLFQALNDRNVWLRVGAAYALIHTEEKANAIRTLNSALFDPDTFARVVAANILLRNDKPTSPAFSALIDGFEAPEIYLRQFSVADLSAISGKLQQRASILSDEELEIAIANLELALKIIPNPRLKILTIRRNRRWLLPHIIYIRKCLAALKQEKQKR